MKKTSRAAEKRKTKMVRVGRSGVHGRGVFATCRIPRGTRIIEYTGEHISWKLAQSLPPLDPENPHHTFFFSLDDGDVINAAVGGNESRWINHSCDPNAKTDERHGCVYVFARREIKKGEELFYDYRLQPADRRTKALEKLFACHCGSLKCRGTMLEARPAKR